MRLNPSPGVRTALILGSVGAVLLILAGTAVTVALVRDGHSTLAGTAVSTTVIAPAPSDEDQIIKVVEQFQQAWNGYEYDMLRALMCAEMRADEAFSRANFAEMRDESGSLNLTVTSIEVTGTTADTVIEHNGADPEDIAFSYEDGGWKWCEF